MRPETAHRIVAHALKPFLKHGHKDLKTLLTPKITRALSVLIEKDKRWYTVHGDYDDRLFDEIYGEMSDERIAGELHYISDRFNATHRLRLIQHVININLL